MKDLLKSKFLNEFCDTCENMYRSGWDERNSGNISYLLSESDTNEYLDVKNVKKVFPLGFSAAALKNKSFLITGTGKFFKNVKKDPENTLGIIRISDDGLSAELLWGWNDGGKYTSELPAHLMTFESRLSADPETRVVLHCHPTKLLAMNAVIELEERTFSRALWKTCTESILAIPEGVGVLPWMLCGTNSIGEATAEKIKDFRIVIWGMHGIYAAGTSLDDTFGRIETVEKSAEIYMLTANLKKINTITDEQLAALVDLFKIDYKKDFLDT